MPSFSLQRKSVSMVRMSKAKTYGWEAIGIVTTNRKTDAAGIHNKLSGTKDLANDLQCFHNFILICHNVYIIA